MNARLRKEFRENAIIAGGLAAVIAALAVAAGVTPLDNGIARIAMIAAFFFGSAFLGAVPLAREYGFDQGGWLLAQPVPRARIWREKWIVSGLCWLGLAAVFLAGATVVKPREAGAIFSLNTLGICFGVFAVGPFMALLGRAPLSSLLLAMGLPFPSLALLAMFLPFSVEFFAASFATLGVAGAIAGFFWFLHSEANTTFMNASVSFSLSGGAQRTKQDATTLRIRPGRPVVAAFGKEWRLALPTLSVSAALGCATALMLIIQPWHADVVEGLTMLHWISQTTFIPAVLGIALVSGDRAPGVREHAMTAPLSVRAQWLIKLGVGLTATLLTAGAFSFGPFLFAQSDQLRSIADWRGVLMLLPLGLTICLLGVYAATASGSTVRALAGAFALLLTVSFIFWGLASVYDRLVFFATKDRALALQSTLHFPGLFFALSLIALAPLGYRNMRRYRSSRQICGQLAGLALAGIFLCALGLWATSGIPNP